MSARRAKVQWLDVDAGERLAYFSGGPYLPDDGEEVVAAGDYEVLREALQRILDHGNTHDEPCHAIHNGDCADVFQEIARTALRAKGV